MNTSDWELSKENIQPLRSGRKAAALANVGGLTPKCRAKEIQDEKNKFEAELRTNQGKDQLEPWVKYIEWVEQTYPKGGKEGNLPTLLEKCIKEFKDDQTYSQDTRYLDVWIKYASMAQKPLDLYNFMFTNQLCTKLPDFYINWAWQLEENGMIKKADQAFRNGIDMVDHSDPKFEVMETKHRQFQSRVMKKMVNDSEVSSAGFLTASSGEEERAVLGSLQGHGKHQKVGSMRIGHAKKSDQPGALPLTARNPPHQQTKPGFAIFQDDGPIEPTFNRPSLPTSNNLPFSKQQNRENEMNAGKWTKSSVVKKSHGVALDKIDSAPHFSVHQDEGLEQPNGSTSHKIQPGESTVLSSRKITNEDDDQQDVAVALFEPLDPTKRPMYCKHLVYQGTTEFSFEEIRGARWRKRHEERELKRKQEEMAKMMRQMEEEKEMMRKQMEAERLAMRQQQEEIRREQERLIGMQQSVSEAVKKQQEDMMRQQEEFRKLKADMETQMKHVTKHPITNQSSSCNSSNSNVGKGYQSTSAGILSSEISSQSQETSTNPSHLQKSSSFLEDTKLLLTYGSNPNSLHKTPTRMDAIPPMTSRQLSMPSPTVNTKEAQMLMQELWGGPCQSVRDTSKNQGKDTTTTNNTVAPFAIYEDDEEQKVEAKSNPTPAAPFAIYQDDEENTHEGKKSRKHIAPIPIFCDEEIDMPVNSFRRNKPVLLTTRHDGDINDSECTTKSKTTEEDKENAPPANEQYLQHKVPTKGPLLVSEKVPYAPLHVQEKVLDDDEREQEMVLEPEVKLGRTLSVDQTMALPTAEDFEEMAKMMSTPMHGKRFIPEEDEFTCAVQLAFKKPLPVARVERTTSPEMQEEIQKNGQVKYSSQQNEKDTSKNSDIDAHHNEDTLPRAVPENPMVMMSPIMETSREYNYKSSSSSSESQWQMTLASNKSHWNGNNTTSGSNLPNGNNTNNAISGATRTPGSMLLSKSTFSKSKTLGTMPAEMTCSSGYIADASSARTPGQFLQKPISSTNGRNFVGLPCQEKEDEDEDEEPTGFFGIMSEFKKGAGLSTNDKSMDKSNISKQRQKENEVEKSMSKVGKSFNQSMQGNTTDVSRLIGGGEVSMRETSALKASFMKGPTINDVSLDCSMPPQSIMQVSNLRQTGPVLELTDAGPSLELTIASPKLELTKPQLDITQNATIGSERLGASYNPLDVSVHRKLLEDLEIPVAKRHGYYKTNANVPNIRSNSIVQVGPTIFNVKECKGEGGYGKVFRASRPREDTNPNETIAEMDSVLKIQKPQPNEWEFYICTELHQRLPKQEDKQWFMSIPRCYVFNDGSIFVSEHQPFTLLDVCNKVQLLGDLHGREIMAMYFTIEMLHVLERLQKAKMIHADIKPENFMIQAMPRLDETSKDSDTLFKNLKASLILIDFGVSIDMALLPENTSFHFKFEKEENLTPEMKEDKPWNYQIDYFGIASIAYTMLYGGYMKLIKKDGKYEPLGKPKRWWNIKLWNSFFQEFLNIEGCNSLPDIVHTRKSFEAAFFQSHRSRFQSNMNDLKNTLYRK